MQRQYDGHLKPRSDTNSQSFAHGLNFYQLFWIFFIGCFLGVVVETIWCLLTRHHYESRTRSEERR